MSQQPKQVERDDATSIYEPDPILGKYISHHPSNRMRLMIIGGSIYAVAVVIIQAIFWNVDDENAAVFVPILFAAVAGAVLWFMLHHWNREVVLYERGFSYRRGSITAYILYMNVVKLIQNLEKVSFLGFSRTVYDYKLITDIDETLTIDNVYSNPDKLTRALEAFIARDRLPIMRHLIQTGKPASFSERLHISQEGIMLDDKDLFWQEFKGQRVKNGQLILQSQNDEAWATIPVDEIDNPVLLIALLKERGRPPEIAQEEIANDEL